ncbi:lqfR [Drosophila busckii]|uniref:LqfR n=1 Tax=Drosophila busckii TaxID=30019 RepID=A0A0M5J2L7_DROBS|nr:lqfR [Drosophila busckii]
MNYTEIEGKVREATNDDPWGPTGPLMQELAHATFSYETFPEVMSMLWKRMLQDNKTNWRRTYKSLLLLNYLVRNGSERVVTSSREHIYDLRSLENYTFTDEGGKDQGINVRHKASRKNNNKKQYFVIKVQYYYRRNYRYNDRASPAEMATENAKSSNLNMNIRAKAVSSPVSKQPTANAKPTMKQQQKINLGAAANFGKQSDAAAAAGIHSPTHRDSPSGNNTSVDLMDNASPNKQHNNSSSNNNNNELLDDLFKTCASVKGEQTLNSAALNDDDDDFNPRAADAPSSQEFGDFSTAFGAAAAPPPSTGLPRAPSNDEFADFTAFQGASTTTQLDAQLLSTATPANDAFDLFASSAPAVTPTPAATSTATDLLAGLGDLSIHQSMPMAAGSQPASASTLTSPPTAAALESLNEAIAQLRSLEQVQSGAQTQLVDNALKQLLLANALPGYVTPQQLLGSDSEQTDWSPLITNGNYAQLLAQLGRLFNQQCPRPEQDRTLLNIYKLDYNLDYIQLAIESLQLQLKRVPITASSMLAALLQDERLLAISLLHMCRQRGVLVQRFAATIKLLPEPQLEQLDAQFGEYLQLLCALPSQVGNALERQLPLLFAPAAYGQLLLQQWLKALHFVLQFDALQQSYDASPFSWLLERVLSQFFDAKLLQQLLQVLQHYALDGNKRPYVQLILRNLKPAACLKLAQTALQAELNLLLLLGAEALQLPHWSHCLLQQLPLQRAPVDIAALCSLVSYLNAVAPAKLRLLFEQLLGIWSKRLTLQKLNQQEHLAMCKLLILSAKCCKELELEQKRQLHQALGHHLQSPDAVQRYMGMNDESAAAARLEQAQRMIKARLLAKTKRYHGKVAAVKAQANAFHAVAGIFFFGLVRGQRTRQMLYVKYECISHDIDTQLLLNMLHTLATFITCAQNCPLLPAMSREIFDLCSFVRFHAEAKVRAATLQLLGIALVTMPAELLALHFADALNELQRWLQEITRSPLVGGESSDDCRELAQQLMDICYQQLNAV